MAKLLFKILSVILLFQSVPLQAEFLRENIEQVQFQYFTTNEGLAQNTVVSILKDRRGFMWFGTWNGLSRFDGYSFVNFSKEDEADGLPNNFIYTLCEDDQGDIWIGTRKGLSKYQFSENRFFIPENLKNLFASFTINDLKIDAHNKLWIATENDGLWCVDLNDYGVVKKVDDELLPNRSINSLHMANDQLFVATNQGLGVIDLGGENAIEAYAALQTRVSILELNSVLVDSSGQVWVGTNYGLFRSRAGQQQVDEYYYNPIDPTSLDHLAVKSIVQAPDGQVIVGTYSGLNFYDPTSNSFRHPANSSLNNDQLNSPFVNVIYTDSVGNVWIGTDKGGVNHYNSNQKPFYSLVHDPANRNSISHNTVNSIWKEKNVLWIGTAGGGLNRVDKGGQRVERFNLEDNLSSGVGDNFVSSIMRSSAGDLWIGTWGGGLKRMVSERNKLFESFVFNEADTLGIGSDFISSLLEIDRQHFLIGTENGVDLFNSQSREFTHLDKYMRDKAKLEVGCLLLDANERVWIGTRKGLYRFEKSYLDRLADIDQIPVSYFQNDPTDSLSISGSYVLSLLQAKDGAIWVGTYGNGICKYNEASNTFTSYTQDDGLCNNVAYALEEDLEGNIWISTDRGLSKFTPSEEHFQNFFVKDGLLSDQFYWSSSFSDGQGNLYFGGIEGLNYFNAESIDIYTYKTKPVFTQFSVFNEPVQVGANYHSKVILSQSISQTNKLNLSYRDAVFSIEFSALDYFLPEKIKYQYKMENVDNDWVEVPASRRFANYTNLSGGVYTFKVRASNSDGIMSDETAELTIVVHPPFYNTAWFRFLLVLIIALLVGGYIRYRTKFLKEQKEKLELQVRERTEQIEEQKEKLEQQAIRLQRTNQQLETRQKLIEGQKVELEQQNLKIAEQRDELIELNEQVKLVNQTRLRFFTNISHEFRTPLTLIIDPLEKLIKSFRGDDATVKTLNIINRNAQRLLHLINQLVYFRRLENGKIDLHVCRADLNEFLNQVFDSFSDLAKHQEVDYQLQINGTKEETWFDAEKLENILYNLLSNAFKYTSDKGRITMSVNFVDNGHEATLACPFVRIEVQDSGQGIDEEHLPYIFERFYQVPSEKNVRMDSSGIGLALTHELVKALHGTIEVKSSKGKGSRFIVCLPYTKERFEEQELDQGIEGKPLSIYAKVDMLHEKITRSGMQEPAAEEAEELDAKSKPLILVVEDNFDLRNFLLQSLKEKYRVLGAENGKEALAIAKKFAPDLVLSDVMMPVMDGIELCSRLKKEIQTSHIPVILLTARNMVENWIEGLETGADDYVPKPFNLDLLIVRINNLIESRRRLRKLFASLTDSPVEELASNAVDEAFLVKAYAILEESHKDPDFSASQFAEKMFVSQSLLYKKLRAIAGLSITDFINSFKLKKAVALLANPQLAISDVAYQVGFNDPKYFSRIFRKFYGCSPSEYSAKKA